MSRLITDSQYRHHLVVVVVAAWSGCFEIEQTMDANRGKATTSSRSVDILMKESEGIIDVRGEQKIRTNLPH